MKKKKYPREELIRERKERWRRHGMR